MSPGIGSKSHTRRAQQDQESLSQGDKAAVHDEDKGPIHLITSQECLNNWIAKLRVAALDV